MLEAYSKHQFSSLGYHPQHLNLTIEINHLKLSFASLMPFRGANVTWCDTPFGVHFRGWMQVGRVTTPPPPPQVQY